jgi:hypothetical protein
MHLVLRPTLKLLFTESALMRVVACNRFHQDILYE